MRLHLIENMKVNGRELLLMLSLMEKILIEIEFYKNQNMNIQDDLRLPVTMYSQSMLGEKAAIALSVYLK